MANKQPVNLYEAEKTQNFEVASVPKIGLLESIGLRIGTRICIKNRYAFGGPVLLRVEGAYDLALGKEIAQQIAVRPEAAVS